MRFLLLLHRRLRASHVVAHSCVRAGHEVTVLDPGPLPNPYSASTDISKLIRPDYGKDEFYMRLMEECIRRWHTLNAVS